MEDEKDILRRMSSGDSDAFRLVFLKYAPRVEAFAMKMLKNIHEAQDVSQNIFTKLWMQRRELAQVQSLNAYLFRMTRNAVLDICKHSRIRMQFETAPGSTDRFFATTLRNGSTRPNCRARSKPPSARCLPGGMKSTACRASAARTTVKLPRS